MAAEEWRQCAEWLIRCEILPSDHKVTYQNAEVFDLAQTLRDGVVLCQLLIKLRPGAIDLKDFSQRPQMSQFLCQKNIRTFLQTCKSVFGLRDVDLFDPSDLFEVKNFGAVIRTLSKLSKSDVARKSNIDGFPLEVGGQQYRPEHDDDIYKNLEELATEMPDEDVYGKLATEEDHQEKVYEDLLSITGPRTIAAPPASPATASAGAHRGSVVSIGSGGEARQPKTKKEYCIEEILGTEKNYVDALEMIHKFFIVPLKNVLEEQSRDLIFNNIEKLLTTHKAMHAELNKAVQAGCTGPGVVPKIADVFVKYKTQLVVYGDYCSQLTKAQNHVDDLTTRSDSVRQKILDQQQLANNGKFKLRDLLAVPMQRVLKYQLLLRELMKHTDKTATDERAPLDLALEAMQDLSLYVNEVKRDREALELISDIQNSILDLSMPDNTELKDYGRLLKDGELRVKSHNDNKECRRYIFLFDKVMMMCKAKGDTYSFKSALILHTHRIDEGAPAATPAQKASSRASDKWRHTFMLVEQSNQSAITFCAKSDDMKQKWIDAIKLALENFQPPGSKENGHDFTMRSFQQATQCDYCGKLLRGCFYQGYLCANTKKKAHKECLPNIVRDASSRGRPLPSISRKVRATHGYAGIPPTTNNKAVLRFDVDNIIEVLNDSDPYWWQGRYDMQTGFFPSSFVEPYRTSNKRLPSGASYERTTIVSPGGSSGRPSQVLQDFSRISFAGTPPDSGAPRLDQRQAAPYINSNNSEHQWFVGRMSRDQATVCLQNVESGVFLVRESDSPSRRGEYALSLKYMGAVKHIKVNRNDPEATYYLADCKFFRSVAELVEYYKANSLEFSFPEVRSTLLVAYKDVVATAERQSVHQPAMLTKATRTMSENGFSGSLTQAPRSTAAMSDSAAMARRSLPPVLSFATASYDYASTEMNQISLRCRDRVAIVSKAGGDKGWWKGYVMDERGSPGRVGYFPLAYVEEEES